MARQSNLRNSMMVNLPPKDSDPRKSGLAGDPAAAPGEGQEGSRTVHDVIAALQAEVADLKDKYLRAHAEIENVRKRAEREKEDTAKFAIAKLARDIVNVGDNFQRAIDAVPAGAAEQDPALKSFLEGVTLTERELLNALERHGIKRIQPVNEPFNPHLHQAVMEIAREDLPAGTIVQVFQAGYTIEDRVLRPAMVSVAKGGAKPPAGAEGSGQVPPPANENAPRR
jgi:molecular chaperone GrpE